MKVQNIRASKKPIDILFIGSVIALLSFLLCLLGLLSVLGIAQLTVPDTRRVFLGLFEISSQVEHGIREIAYGLWGIIASLGLIKLKNWARYLLIIYHIICMIDIFFVFSRFSLATSLSYIFIELLLVVWLIYRRSAFQIM